MSESVLPMFSSRSFIVSDLTFRSWESLQERTEWKNKLSRKETAGQSINRMVIKREVTIKENGKQTRMVGRNWGKYEIGEIMPSSLLQVGSLFSYM